MSQLHQIKRLIGEGKLEDSLRILIDFAQSAESEYLNDLLGLQANLKRMTSRNRLQGQSIDERVVVAGALEIADELLGPKEDNDRRVAVDAPEKIDVQLDLCHAVIAGKKSRYVLMMGLFLAALLGALVLTLTQMSGTTQHLGYLGTFAIGGINILPAKEIIGLSTSLALISKLKENSNAFDKEDVEKIVHDLISKMYT